jgi:hypothetical protein
VAHSETLRDAKLSASNNGTQQRTQNFSIANADFSLIAGLV